MKLAKFKSYLKEKSIYKDGTSPIYICIKKYRKEALINVGYSVPAQAWNEEEGLVYESKPKITLTMKNSLPFDELEKLASIVVVGNPKTINSEIKRKLSELTLLQDKLRANGEDLEAHEIKQRYLINPNQDRSKSFIAYANEIVNSLLKAGNIGTYKRYKSVTKKLEEYLKGKPFSFKDLNVQFLREYDAYLKSKSLRQNTIHNQQKTLRAIFYMALSEQLIPQDKNPYLSFKLKPGVAAPKPKLTIDEIKTIQALELAKGSRLWHVRNCFLLSFNNAGIRIGDMLQLKWENVTKEGRLQYQMDKTERYKSTILNQKSLAILNEYYNENAKPKDYIFPFLSNDIDYSDSQFLWNQVSSKTTIINYNLKKIGELAGIDKHLSSHISRHSFGGIAIKKKTSIYDLRDLFEHSSVKVTEQYLTGLNHETKDEAMLEILDF